MKDGGNEGFGVESRMKIIWGNIQTTRTLFELPPPKVDRAHVSFSSLIG